jgi:hypothetical protein
MRRTAAAAILGLLTAGAPLGAAEMEPRPPRSVDPRPRDGNVAIQEELDAARRAGTLAAFDRFLARHPGHALAAAARRERQRLLRARSR